MRKKSHISLAGELLHGLGLDELMGHKYFFYVGSILPDCRPSFLTTPHNIQKTFEMVQEKIQELIERFEQKKQFTISCCANLGVITHYIADYFTFPHNTHYDGSLKDHCIYEGNLKLALYDYIHSGEANKHKKEIKLYATPEELFGFIKRTHNEYLSKKRTVMEDCRYIVRLSMEVIASIIGFFNTSLVEKLLAA